jgi:D,D-heptose 1,7-bisphosphate phosphatase
LRYLASKPLPDHIFARLALRRVGNAGRFGTVRLAGEQVIDFIPCASVGENIINAGVYVMRRALLERIVVRPCSLEQQILPAAAREGILAGTVFDNFFIDIGVPEDYGQADYVIGAHSRRPAVFFDRDGVLNQDEGYTHRPEDLTWIPGAIEAVRAVNAAGWYTFVVSNQAGVAHGYYSEADVDAFHRFMDSELAIFGAHIDEFRYSPFHPKAAAEAYRRDSNCRKPRPGMILDLLSNWPVDQSRSFLIGDKLSDLEAAKAAGIAGHLYQGGELVALISELIASSSGARQ